MSLPRGLRNYTAAPPDKQKGHAGSLFMLCLVLLRLSPHTPTTHTLPVALLQVGFQEAVVVTAAEDAPPLLSVRAVDVRPFSSACAGR